MNSGAFRKKKVYFTQVSNNILRDNSISLKAKGLYSLIQSYITIEGFTLYKTFLMKQCKEGERAFESTWKELKDTGYLIQYKLKDDKTGVFYYEYELMDEPVQNNVVEEKNKDINDNRTPDLQNDGMENLNLDLQNVGGGNAGSGKGISAKGSEYNNTDGNNTYLTNTIRNKKEESTIHNIKPIQSFLDAIKEDMTDVSYRTWIEPLEINIEDHTAILKTKDSFSKQVIEEKFLDIIKAKAIDIGLRKVDIV